MEEIRIRPVQGNWMQLGVPLTLQTVTMVNGNPEVTVTEFVPNPSYPVEIILKRGSKEHKYDARMDGNIAVFEDDGTLEAGIYSMTVLCRDSAGKQKRYKQRDSVKIVDLTAEAGIEPSIEYNTEVHILDAAVFMAVSGVGIANWEVTESHESGGENVLKIILTDGREFTFTVRNGVDGNAVLRHEALSETAYNNLGDNVSNTTIYLILEDE